MEQRWSSDGDASEVERRISGIYFGLLWHVFAFDCLYVLQIEIFHYLLIPFRACSVGILHTECVFLWLYDAPFLVNENEALWLLLARYRLDLVGGHKAETLDKTFSRELTQYLWWDADRENAFVLKKFVCSTDEIAEWQT